MLFIQKLEEPTFLTSYIKKHPTANYESESFRPFYHVLKSTLIKEQKGLCAYCCGPISMDNSHNEHIEPQHQKDGTYSRRSLDYDNIVASCNSASTCGSRKGNNYDEQRFVSPLQKGCEQRFSYDPDGYIRGDEYTISLLNLNSYRLRQARKAVFKMIMNMRNDDIRSAFCCDQEQYWPYSNVISWYLREKCD
ncbi:MAG: hypothetical protein IJT16_00945 [Lachnospiraceae bacterium]|nr:hypothetical protein [Lachnospiraceae bacterium]